MDDLINCIVFLRKQVPAYELKGGKYVEVWNKESGSNNFEQKFVDEIVGSGFIVLHNDRSYLVTAKHVSRKLESKPFAERSEFISNLVTGKTFSMTFRKLESLDILTGSKWFYHKTADLAIHPIASIKEISSIRSIPSRRLYKESDNMKFDLLSKCYIIGFPLGLGLGEIISPLAKEARISSGITNIDREDFNPVLKFILLDEALAQGYSGAPVFLSKDFVPESLVNTWGGAKPVTVEKFQLIGLVSGTFSDDTGGKISAIIPISYIWDIFNSPEFLQYEKKLGAKN